MQYFRETWILTFVKIFQIFKFQNTQLKNLNLNIFFGFLLHIYGTLGAGREKPQLFGKDLFKEQSLYEHSINSIRMR